MKGIAVICLLLAGCATTSSISKGPNGRPMFNINGTLSSAAAYEKAAQKCPNGYDVIHSRQQGIYFVLDVECR